MFSSNPNNLIRDDTAFTRSDDFGLTWELPVILSVSGANTDVYNDINPKVAAFNGSSVVVCWEMHDDTAPVNKDILVRVSHDNGTTWSPEMRIAGGDTDSDSEPEGVCYAAGDPGSPRAMVRLFDELLNYVSLENADPRLSFVLSSFFK